MLDASRIVYKHDIQGLLKDSKQYDLINIEQKY